MNKSVICFVMAAMFLLPTVNCVTVSVKTNVGDFTEHLGAGIGGQINGNTVITRDALSHAVWANGPVTSGNNKRGCYYASTKSVSDNAGDTASTSVSISNAKSYSYSYGLSNMGSFAAAAEALDVTGASSINAQAKAYNTKVAAPDVCVSTTVTNGDLHGYNNMAIAAANLGYAFQSFDSATGTKVQCDSVARGLSSKWSSAQENAAPEASISTSTTTAGTTITNYEDSVTKSSSGTSIEQNARVEGTFSSTSIAKAANIKRTSDYGTRFDLDMQANIAKSTPSVTGTLGYYVYPSVMKIQKAVDLSRNGDTINVAKGTYLEDVNIKGKAVTVRGDNVNVNSVNNVGVGGKVYLNSEKVLMRADDMYGMNAGWQWYLGLTKDKDIATTLAVVPNAWNLPSAIGTLQSLDKNKYELAAHGFNGDEYFQGLPYSDQYNLINQAKNVMTEYFYRPRTLITPYGAFDQNTLQAAKDLGYHSVSVKDWSPSIDGILNFVPGFLWETNWDNPNDIPHDSAANFEKVFDVWYSHPEWGPFTVVMHPDTFLKKLSDGSTQLKTGDTGEFEESINYMKTKNVEFMTMEQANDWYNNKWLA